MKVVLYQPQIPQNTGNVVRTCSVTGSSLLLVEPLGFSTHDRWLRRAGLDYWEGVDVQTTSDLLRLLESKDTDFYFFSSKATKLYTEIPYTQDTWLIFGSESDGLPEIFWERWRERFVKIPMIEGSRCLNLATSVGIGVYEGLRAAALLTL